MSQDLQQKWIDFANIRQNTEQNKKEYIDARNFFIEHYYHLVIKVAKKMHKKINEVDVDTLVSWGLDGLIDAINKFDLSMENKFETFSYHRIRGSILDNIRKVDWVPRLVRQRHSLIQKKKNDLECSLGRPPNDEEVAEALKMSMEEYADISAKSNPYLCVSLFSNSSENSGKGSGEDKISQIENIASVDSEPIDDILKQEMFNKLLGKNFVPLERKIIHLHYYENLTMKEIAEKTGYSESRISQMHAKILERIKRKADANPQYMKDLESALKL